MSTTDGDTQALGFVVAHTWKALGLPAKKSILHTAFFDEEAVWDVATTANLTFCPGLMDVVQSPTPPDVQKFFKKLDHPWTASNISGPSGLSTGLSPRISSFSFVSFVHHHHGSPRPPASLHRRQLTFKKIWQRTFTTVSDM